MLFSGISIAAWYLLQPTDVYGALSYKSPLPPSLSYENSSCQRGREDISRTRCGELKDRQLAAERSTGANIGCGFGEEERKREYI